MTPKFRSLTLPPPKCSLRLPEMEAPSTPDARARHAALARFATAAAAEGVELPPHPCPDIHSLIQAQWTQFISRRLPTDAALGLGASLRLRLTETSLAVAVDATSRLRVIRLKPVIEALEASAPGLGWFVETCIRPAPCYGHALHGLWNLDVILGHHYWDLDDFTDEGLASAILGETGQDPPVGQPVAQRTMRRLRRRHAYWPSAVMPDIGGHAHLVCMNHRPPRLARPRDAQGWLTSNGGHPHARVVQQALRLQAAFGRTLPAAPGDDLMHAVQCSAPTAVVAWDNPRLLFEAAAHGRHRQLVPGEEVHAMACFQVHFASPTIEVELRRMARHAAAFATRWARLNELLAGFPVWQRPQAA